MENVLTRWNRLSPPMGRDRRQILVDFSLSCEGNFYLDQIMNFEHNATVTTDIAHCFGFAVSIILHAHRTAAGTLPLSRVKKSKESLLEYRKHAVQSVIRVVNNAEVVEVRKIHRPGDVCSTVLDPETSRALVIEDDFLKTASRDEAVAQGLQHHMAFLMENGHVDPVWKHAVQCKVELDTVVAREDTHKIREAENKFFDASVSADARRVSIIRRKFKDVGYSVYGERGFARLLKEWEIHDSPREEEMHILFRSFKAAHRTKYKRGDECLAEALCSFRAYHNGTYNPAVWSAPAHDPFIPTSSKPLRTLLFEYKAVRNPSLLVPPDLHALLHTPLRNGVAQERLCSLLLKLDDRRFIEQMAAVERFVCNLGMARSFVFDLHTAKKEAILFLQNKGTPMLDFFSTDMDAVATLSGYLHRSKDVIAMLRTHRAFNVEALRRRIPRLVFDPSTEGWCPHDGTIMFKTGTLFNVGVVFAKEDPFTRVDILWRRPPSLKATLRFDTPSAALVPDVASGPPLQMGVANTNRENGSMCFNGSLNRVRVLAGSYEYRNCFIHEIETELNKIKEDRTPMPSHIQETEKMLARNKRMQHFFLQVQLNGTSMNGHEVNMTARTPPFAVSKHPRHKKRPRN